MAWDHSIRGCLGRTTLDGQRRRLHRTPAQENAKAIGTVLGNVADPGEWALLEPAHDLTRLFGKHAFLWLHLSPGCPFVCHGPVPLFLSPVHQFGRGSFGHAPGKNVHHLAPKEPKIHSSGSGRDSLLVGDDNPTLEGIQSHAVRVHPSKAIGWESARRQFGMNGMPFSQKPVQTNAQLVFRWIHCKIEARRHPNHIGNGAVNQHHLHALQSIAKALGFPEQDFRAA